MVKDEYGNKLEGFYLVGFFDKGKVGKISIEKSKPFQTDVNGVSHGKCFEGYPSNSFPEEWVFFESEVKTKDIPRNKQLREEIDETWKEWCAKHKRKFSSIWDEEAIKKLEEEKQ